MFLNKPLKILLATNALIIIATTMIGPIYAIYVEEIGGNLLDASIAGGLLALAAGVTALLSGAFTDKIKESELIVILGYAIVGIGFTLYIFVDTIIFLFAVQVLIGIGQAIYWPAYDSLYSKHLVRKAAGRGWGAWESMAYFMSAIGAFVGGYIAFTFGFDVLFIVMAVIAFSTGLYMLILPRKSL